jgi:nucleoid-associated protein YgaU
MFLKNSRYFGLPTVTTTDRAGGEVAAVKLRPLPSISGDPVTVRAHDQLDAMSEQRYADATRYWHIADANTELEAASVLKPVGRPINVPAS